MKLTIDGKPYDVPVLNAADYEDFEDMLRKTADSELHFIDRNKAVVGILASKMQRTYPELELIQIKRSITMPQLMPMFNWICLGKNDVAQLPTAESQKS